MIVHNVRLGFATNSSSTHSLIFLQGARDKGEDFGWDHFTAASKECKTEYLALLVDEALRRIVDAETADLIVRQLLGVEIPANTGIDHQSRYELPMNWEGNGLDYQFLEEFKEFLLRDDVVVLGGNDNGDDSHPLDNGKSFVLNMPVDWYSRSWVSKRDPQGFWTLFNRDSGAKFRMTFPKNDSGMLKKNDWERRYNAGVVNPLYSTTPELIDLKITDFCDKGCSYCYQNSNPNGKHADVHMWPIINALAKLKVFEVAIGGGEPTRHPKFVSILEDFRSAGIVPSFSTKDLSWMCEPRLRDKILANIGSYAFSTESVEELKQFVAYHRTYCNTYKKHPIVHYVMGPQYGFEYFLQEAKNLGVSVVLLGYKNKGRAKNIQETSSHNWVETVMKLRETGNCPTISADTSLINESFNELKGVGISEVLMNREEGKFSMYVDLVNMKMGPSSFCDEDQMLPLHTKFDIYEQIFTAFRTF